MNSKSIIHWALRIIASVILLQTLYYKFTAHPESVLYFHPDWYGALGTNRHRNL